MNPHKTSWILFPIVLMIWAGLFLQWEKVMSPNHPSSPKGIAPLPMVFDSLGTMAFQLKLDYRDPFLGRQRPPTANVSANSITQRSSAPPLQNFQYLGGVQRPADARLTGLVSWSGKLLSIEIGHKIDSWEVKQLSLQRLVLKRGSRSLTFYVQRKNQQP